MVAPGKGDFSIWICTFQHFFCVEKKWAVDFCTVLSVIVLIREEEFHAGLNKAQVGVMNGPVLSLSL